MWYRHWGLSRPPFDEASSPYVSLPSHDEATYRLVDSIEQGHRQVILQAEAGMGKTTVLRRAIAETRSPRRRIVMVQHQTNGITDLTNIVQHLGHSISRDAGGESIRRELVRSLRVTLLEGYHLILAIDERSAERGSGDLPDLDLLTRREFGSEGRLTFIRVRQDVIKSSNPAEVGWLRPVRLLRLTRSESDDFLGAKLTAAGSPVPIFTPRAVTRLHALSGGVPRVLERLATLSLIGGASRGFRSRSSGFGRGSRRGMPWPAIHGFRHAAGSTGQDSNWEGRVARRV